MNTPTEIREQARQNVLAALQTGNAHSPLRTTDLASVSQDRAVELLSNRFSAFAEMLSVAKEMKSLADSMQRDLADAVQYVSGEPGRFNSLGVLQASGPRFDGYCMVFPIRVEQAIDAEAALLTALATTASHRFMVGDRLRAADAEDIDENYGEVVELTRTNGNPSYTLLDLFTRETITDVLDNPDLVGE